MSLLWHRLDAWLANRPLLRFVLSVCALLPACFLVWYFLGAFLAGPSALLAEQILTTWLSDLVIEARLDGAQFVVRTSLGEINGAFIDAQTAGNQIGYSINTRTLSYSVPFFAALHFATPQRSGVSGFAWALLALWLLMAVGLVAMALKDLMVGLGRTLLEQPGMPPGDVIALAYQFSVLMVPPLAPVVLWAYLAADSPAFRTLFDAARRPDQVNDSTS